MQKLGVDEPGKRVAQLDFLRTVAIVLVLIIHSSTRYGQGATENFIGGWMALFSRPTIAIFIFISGYLYRTTQLTYPYLFRRLARVLTPYLFFSLLAYFARYKLATFAYVSHHPLNVLSDLLLGRTWEIYYFVFVIVTLYILGFFILRSQYMWIHLDRLVIILLIINLLHGALFIFAARRLGIENAEPVVLYRYRTPLVWAVFFFLGVWARKNDFLHSINGLSWAIRLAWVGIFVVYNILYAIQSPAMNIDGYDSVIGSLYSLSTIGLLLTFDSSTAWFAFISRISFYIYLTHIFFVYGLSALFSSLQPGFIIPFWFTPVSVILSFFGPILLFFPIKKLLGNRSLYLIGA